MAIYVFGVGQREIARLTKPSVSEVGSTSCQSGRYVQVNAAIFGGGADNRVTGQARCGGSTVTACTTRAPIDGLVNNCQASAQQSSGVAGCAVSYATVNPPESSWTVICQFE